MTEREQRIEITLNSVFQRKQDQVYSVVDDEIVLLSLAKGQYFALNQTASKIWNLLKKPVTVKSIIDALMIEFDVSNAECEFDTINCIKELYISELIEETNQ